MSETNPEHSNLTKLGEGGPNPSVNWKLSPTETQSVTMWWN